MTQIINEKSFLPALQYNAANSKQISGICSPLENFNITTFSFFRLLDNGNYIIISNNSFFSKLVVHNDYFYNTEYLRKNPQHLSRYKLNKFIWPDEVKDEAIEALYTRE